MVDLGFNYRMTDIQCALGISQLEKLPAFLARRREIAGRYDKAFKGVEEIVPLACRDDVSHAYHLYGVRVRKDRDGVFKRLREMGIGGNMHYIPVHLHPFYRETVGKEPGALAGAESQYARIMTLPIHPEMMASSVGYCIGAVRDIFLNNM